METFKILNEISADIPEFDSIMSQVTTPSMKIKKTKHFPCEKCGKILTSPKNYKRHIIKRHFNIHRYSCTVC